MPLQDHMQIISVDDHLIEHPRVFTDRLPAKYLAEGPREPQHDDPALGWALMRLGPTQRACVVLVRRSNSPVPHGPSMCLATLAATMLAIL